MYFNLGKIINKKDVNFFIIFSFFLIFLGFVLSKGYIKNEEFSDIIFLVSSVVLIELAYLAISNQKISFKLINKIDYFIFIIFLVFLFLVWNSEIIYNYKNIFIFFLTKVILATTLVVLINFHENNKIDLKNIDFFLQILILSILLTGLFYQINYTSLDFFPKIVIFSITLLLICFVCSKLNEWIDIFLSLVIFFLLTKLFLLSSEKDAFHYSWFLGPINSLSENYKLLDNVASQYGYLNILIINKLSNLFKINSVYTLCSFIIILFFIYFKIFYVKISKIIKLPISIVTLFLCFMIFGNIGYSNLAGAMFIPSSSVFRFLPSLVTIIIFSEIIKNEKKTYILLFFLSLSLLISLLWSFESAIFVIFPLCSYYIIKFILNLSKFRKHNYLSKINNYKIILSLTLSFTLFFIIYNSANNFSLFYEHALNTTGSLSKEIVNNKVSLIFLYLLILCYVVLRDSFENKKDFNLNILWFGLFVVYSGYFIVRSVDNNIFSILPFIIFIICSMRTNSNQIKNLKIYTLYTIIFFTIISSFYSLTLNKDKFFNNLISTNFLKIPIYKSENYLPNEEILKSIKDFPNVPLTFITGKNIHIKNSNLPQFGYGLPILPLESFNILKDDTKQNLINNYFTLNEKHLILCLNECKFYNSYKDSNTYSKIFLGNSLKFKKITDVKTETLKESLFILSIK